MAVPDRLFRQEVIEFRQLQREWGGIVLLQPVPMRVLTWSMPAALAVIILFLCIAQYARKETVAGYLTFSAGRTRIFAVQNGTVKSVHVEEGQFVQEGQRLLTIETAQVSADGQDVNNAMLASLTSQREHLGRQIAAETRRGVSEQQRLTAIIAGLENEVSHLTEAIRVQNERIVLSETSLSALASLKQKGHISEVEFSRRRQEVLAQQQGLSSLNQQLATRQNQLTETRYGLEQLPTMMAQKVQLLRNEFAAAEQRIAEIEGRRAYVIRAPSAGQVATLQATVGQVADPRRLQMEILPSGSVLQAELFIPTRAAGFAKVGQDVRLLYDAFPYQKFGTYRGRITHISQTVVTSSDVSGPVTLREPAYKAVAALSRPDVDAGGKSMPLQADMLLTADIILEKRTIISWFFSPLLGRTVFETESVKQAITDWGSYVWNSGKKTLRWLIEEGSHISDMTRDWLSDAGVLRREPDPFDVDKEGRSHRDTEPLESRR